MKTIGIIREEKKPYDLRSPLTPSQCVELTDKFPGAKVFVQSSPHRCYTNAEYTAFGIEVQEDMSNCDILLGVKEVPVQSLIKNKTYLFFSHTIKKQPHNIKMLRHIIENKIRLVDYETLVWDSGNRIIGFGRFAGIVGSHYAFLLWGKRHGLYNLKFAHDCKGMDELYAQYEGLPLKNMKIVLCGDGRVAHGVMEFMKKLQIHHVSQEEFLENEYEEAVYVQLRSEDYYFRKDDREWDKSDFYKHPEEYESRFEPYSKKADVLINAMFWKEGIAPLFTSEQMKSKNFRIRVISDITCDVPGPLPSTVRSTTIENPIYGYNQYLGIETQPFQKPYIDVQAVGNLPCELPLEASVEFGEQLLRHVLPNLLIEDKGDIIKNATITENGKLTEKYSYLTDYVA
ncbi:MAG: NAD(P)-dependent oxidoreductase [Bacteroidia bacterium]